MIVAVVVPEKDAPHFKKFFQAYAHAWILDNSIEHARQLFLEEITRDKWILQSFQAALEIADEQIPDLDKSDIFLRDRAFEHGIAIDYITSPI